MLVGDITKELDITKHELVPKHIILNENERNELLKQYGIAPKQLPRILASDPVIELLGGKPGDIVKIIRKSPIAGETPYYKIVIKG